MRLSKHHGLGNDFLVALDPASGAVDAARARRLCDRRTGVGADGLIVGTAEGDGVRMVLFNSDGSLAEISGNGLRCLGQAVARRHGHSSADLLVATDAGRHAVEVRPTSEPHTSAVVADMGTVSVLDDGAFAQAEAVARRALGVDRTGRATIGNPHVVAEVDDAAAVDLAAVGPMVESTPDGGVNLEVITARGGDAIDLAVWERGAGITRACGSGACVAAHFARSWGLVGETVDVVMPGGTARVHLGEVVRLEGPAVWVADVEVADE